MNNSEMKRVWCWRQACGCLPPRRTPRQSRCCTLTLCVLTRSRYCPGVNGSRTVVLQWFSGEADTPWPDLCDDADQCRGNLKPLEDDRRIPNQRPAVSFSPRSAAHKITPMSAGKWRRPPPRRRCGFGGVCRCRTCSTGWAQPVCHTCNHEAPDYPGRSRSRSCTRERPWAGAHCNRGYQPRPTVRST